MTDPSVSRYLLGVAAFLIIVVSLAFAAVTIRRRCLTGWSGALARLAEAVVGFALLTLMLELLGAVGLFSLLPIVIASLLIAVVATRAIGAPPPTRTTPSSRRDAAAASPFRSTEPGHPAAGQPRPADDPPRPATRPPLLAAVAVAAAAAVAAEWSAITLRSYDVGIRTFDSVWYHLPWAAWFAQTGHVTPLRFTDVEYLTPFYPATAELFHGLGIVLFARDTASPGLNLMWLGLVLLAGYCLGRPRGVGALTLTATALALAVPAIDVSQAGSAANDVVGVFFVLAAAALLLNGGARLGHRAAYVLAAAAAGLAVSVKLSMLGPVLALTVGAIAIARRGERRLAAIFWLVPLLITGSFWYLRNLIVVGNPLPWLNLPGLATPAPALQQHTGFPVAHYLTSGHAWTAYFEPGLASGFGPWWYVILAMAIAGPVLCLLPAGRTTSGATAPERAAAVADRDRPAPERPHAASDVTVRMLALVALASLVAYLVTPETAAGPDGQPLGFAFNLRYAAPVLALSLPLLPLGPVLDGALRRLALAGGLVAILAATLAQARLWPARDAGGAIAVGVAVALIGALGSVLRARSEWRPLSAEGARRPQPPPSGEHLERSERPLSSERVAQSRRLSRPAVVAAGAALLLIAAVAAGYPWQRHYLRGRYAYHPGVSSLARVWAFFRDVHRTRVGIVGTFGGFFSYPLFGIDDSNHVEYIGRRGPHGSFTSIRSCAEWRAAVNAGHFRYLVTTPARDPWHPKPLHTSPERAWTVTDPAARLIYTHRAFGQPISIFELRGRLRSC